MRSVASVKKMLVILYKMAKLFCAGIIHKIQLDF